MAKSRWVCVQVICFLFLIGAFSAVTAATELPPATLTTFSGQKIAITTEKYSRYSLTLNTPWYAGAQKFEGVHLLDLLKDLQPGVLTNLDHLEVLAYNGYKTEIPVRDVLKHDLLLASARNGVPLTVRDKGPFFILYPFSADDSLNVASVYSKCAWQIKEIRLIPTKR